MSLVCYGSPNIRSVDQLYIAGTEEGSLYSGTGTPPFCNSTSPPLPSGCVVCVYQSIHAVCGDLLKNKTLVMEGSGKHIKLIKSVCPTLLGNATNEYIDMSGNNAGASCWLLPVGILLVIAIIAVVCGRKYWTKRRREALKQIEEEEKEEELKLSLTRQHEGN